MRSCTFEGRSVQSRRDMLRGGLGASAAAATVVLSAAPGRAQTGAAASTSAGPPAALKLASPFTRDQDAVVGPMIDFARTLATLTGETLTLDPSGVPVRDDASALASVESGAADLAHVRADTLSERFAVLGLAGGAPFGLNARLHSAWLHDRGGLAIVNAALATSGLRLIPCGASGAAMGGWFREELTGPDSLAGRRIAIQGFGARILAELGATPVTLEAGALRGAIERREVDGAFLGAPYDEEGLRLFQAADVLHYPGWWNGAGQYFLVAKSDRLEALTPQQRTAIEAAAAIADRGILARYDAQNAGALKRAAASGARLAPYSEALLQACFAATSSVLDKIANNDASFAQVRTSMNDVRRDGFLWFQVAESTFDTFMMIQQRNQEL